MSTPERLDYDLTDEEFDAVLCTIPFDLESTPEEDAEDLAAFARGEEQFASGQWITLEELGRRYPD